MSKTEQDTLFGGIDSLDDYINLDETITTTTKEEGNIEEPPSDKPGTSDKDEPKDDGTIEIPDKKVEDKDTKDDSKPEDEFIIKDDDIDDKKEKESQQDEQSSPSIDDAQISAYTNFMENLYNTGTLSSFDKDEFVKQVKDGKDPNELIVEAKKNEIESRVKEELDSLTDEDRAIYEGKKAGVPLDRLGQIDKALNYYESLDEDFFENSDNEDVVRQIVSIDLKNRGFSEEEVQEQLDIYEEKDTLMSKGKKANSTLINNLSSQKESVIKESEEAKKQQAQQIEEYKKQLKDTISGIDEIVPDLKINKELKDQLYEDFTKPVKYEDDRPIDVISDVRNKNPEMFDVALRYYNRLGLFNFDKDGKFKPDFSKINNNIRTKESKRIKNIVSNNDAFIPGNKQKSTKGNKDLFGGI